ncbi:hypothetical protein [Frondihabitans peucedani]|uniref:hypothetical protein n=1 Tax=Frondihabitans peucedani TaxID=598626 RepID=UPI0031D3640B
MVITKIRIDGQSFLLDSAEDVLALRKRIQDAARTSPTFVDFKSVGHGTVSVLVSATRPVRFEQIERTEGEYEEMRENPPGPEIDLLGLEGLL